MRFGKREPKLFQLRLYVRMLSPFLAFTMTMYPFGKLYLLECLLWWLFIVLPLRSVLGNLYSLSRILTH